MAQLEQTRSNGYTSSEICTLLLPAPASAIGRWYEKNSNGYSKRTWHQMADSLTNKLTSDHMKNYNAPLYKRIEMPKM